MTDLLQTLAILGLLLMNFMLQRQATLLRKTCEALSRGLGYIGEYLKGEYE